MTIKFLESQKTETRPEIFLYRIGHSIRPQFQTSSLIETFEKWLRRLRNIFHRLCKALLFCNEPEMRIAHFHQDWGDKFPSS
jgi:hypothetical protein